VVLLVELIDLEGHALVVGEQTERRLGRRAKSDLTVAHLIVDGQDHRTRAVVVGHPPDIPTLQELPALSLGDLRERS